MNPDADPLWYKDAVVYEVHVRAFFDSNDDGMGDFPGLTEKLDYLKDLGVTTLWVLPFSPSPWRDDGYDISDYTGVHPSYGTLKDFQVFLREAHKRGLRVITELVINHTSDQHEWFQRSRRAAAGSPWRDFYVWSDTPERYSEARIIFQDFETSNWTYDPVAKAYFWHRFYSHQPDLNFDNPAVRRAVLRVLDFWANMGVDGFRLDAVPYLFEREGTNCENLPETHEFLKEIRAHLDTHHKGRMLLSEANMWPEDAIQYMGDGDECQMSFHFPLMPRLFMANRLEDRFPIVEILKRTPPIPESCQWALFLRNHDELTLEMVTDEERDYMYRTYAEDRKARINLGIRRRLAPLLEDNRPKIELMNALLFSLPGTPVLYYGDEIGMGDNFYLGDRNGVRTPMQWSADRNAGFSKANPQRLFLPVNIDPEYHYEARNVETQQNNPASLLWWTKRLIRMRKQYKAFGRGTLEFLNPDNRRVLAFYRRFENENILVVANLSRFSQAVTLNLQEFKGKTLVEMFGGAEFPVIGEQHYTITLGPNAFYWFSLELRAAGIETTAEASVYVPAFQLVSSADLWAARGRDVLAQALPKFLSTRRWFPLGDRRIRAVSVVDIIAVAPDVSGILLVRIEYDRGEPEMYSLPMAVAMGEKAEEVRRNSPDLILAEVQERSGLTGIIYGALWDKNFCNLLLEAVARRRKLRSDEGEMAAVRTRVFRSIWGERHPNVEPYRLRSEQRNISVSYGDKFILKMYRRVEGGIHPEVEVGEMVPFGHFPQLAGWLEYRPNDDVPIVLGVLHGYVPHESNAYTLSLTNLSQFFEEAQLATPDDPLLTEQRHPLVLAREKTPSSACKMIGQFLDRMGLLGQRVGEMHIAMAAVPHPAFEPESFSDHYRRALYHGMVGEADATLEMLRRRASRFGAELQPDIENVLSRADDVRLRFQALQQRQLEAFRIRQHGDLRLGQVLDNGKDFTIVDLEGDATHHLSERRIKRPPFKDVARMLSSFRWASYAALFGEVAGVGPGTPMQAPLEGWARVWYQCVTASFLNGYLGTVENEPFFPKDRTDVRVLLDAYLLQQAVDDLQDELAAPSGRLKIPLQDILQLLAASN